MPGRQLGRMKYLKDFISWLRNLDRRALVSVLGCPNNAPLAFTPNWEKRMTAETYAKWHARFRWIENTPENDKTYNFEKNVITGRYTQRIKNA